MIQDTQYIDAFLLSSHRLRKSESRRKRIKRTAVCDDDDGDDANDDDDDDDDDVYDVRDFAYESLCAGVLQSEKKVYLTNFSSECN